MTSLTQSFREILQDNGLTPSEIIMDGVLHRCPTADKPHKQNGAYIAHADSPATLWWYNWENGEQGSFTVPDDQPRSPAEREALQRRMSAIRQQREAECAKRQASARETARNELQQSVPCTSDHPYLQRKGVPALPGVRQNAYGCMLLPICNASGELQTLQYILSNGSKMFLFGGKMQGGYFVIQGKPEQPLVVCEGYATGASIHLASNKTVYVAFSANNMPAVARSVRAAFPHATLLICGDCDPVGSSKAQEAAQAANGIAVLPTFSTGQGTDFNDLHQTEGLPEVCRQLEAALCRIRQSDTPAAPVPSLVSLEIWSFLSMPLPERGFLLSPVLPVQGIGILYAPRGIGKTFAALSVAVAVASGGTVFHWRAPMPKRTLYVDGEMPAASMQTRLAALVGGMAVPPHTLSNMHLVTPDLQPCPMPDLSTASGQSLLEPLLKNVDMVVLDNIATLCRTGKENESQSWQTMQAWLLDLRRRGITVLLVHHAGKSGDQRGTSAREDIMDTVISLRRPKEYSMAEGARFEVHLTKARGIVGNDAKPFEAKLVTEGNVLHWDVKELEDVELNALQRLLEDGCSIRECAEEMGKSKGAVQRLKKQLEAR